MILGEGNESHKAYRVTTLALFSPHEDTYFNYQRVRPRRVFRWEFKEGEEGLRTPNPRLLMEGVAVPGTAPANYISGAS